MGAFLSVLESWVWGDLYWIEPGLQKGYFPRGKQWEMHHVTHTEQLLAHMVVRLSSVSLVGQGPSLLNENVGKALLAILVARPELEVLRVPVMNREHNDAIHLWVTAQRPTPRATTTATLLDQQQQTNTYYPKKLRLECYYVGNDGDNEEAQHWHDLTQLPSGNVLAVTAEKKNEGIVTG